MKPCQVCNLEVDCEHRKQIDGFLLYSENYVKEYGRAEYRSGVEEGRRQVKEEIEKEMSKCHG